MAIIYSYPNAATPTTNDVLLGTKMDNDKETKGFTIASLAALVSVTSGTGTVTSARGSARRGTHTSTCTAMDDVPEYHGTIVLLQYNRTQVVPYMYMVTCMHYVYPVASSKMPENTWTQE